MVTLLFGAKAANGHLILVKRCELHVYFTSPFLGKVQKKMHDLLYRLFSVFFSSSTGLVLVALTKWTKNMFCKLYFFLLFIFLVLRNILTLLVSWVYVTSFLSVFQRFAQIDQLANCFCCHGLPAVVYLTDADFDYLNIRLKVQKQLWYVWNILPCDTNQFVFLAANNDLLIEFFINVLERPPLIHIFCMFF